MAIALVNPDPLLFVLQISDSALPIGGFSHSWGLETAVQAGRLPDAAAVERYLQGLIHLTLLPQEAQACRLGFQAHGDPERWTFVTRYLTACRWAQEPHHASLQLGKRLATWGEKHWRMAAPPGPEQHHSPVFGWLCAQAGVTESVCVQAYLWSTLVALTTAAVKLVPLGQSQGQTLLCHFQPILVAGVAELLQQPPDILGSFAPLHERDCQHHQHLYSRLFQS